MLLRVASTSASTSGDPAAAEARRSIETSTRIADAAPVIVCRAVAVPVTSGETPGPDDRGRRRMNSGQNSSPAARHGQNCPARQLDVEEKHEGPARWIDDDIDRAIDRVHVRRRHHSRAPRLPVPPEKPFLHRNVHRARSCAVGSPVRSLVAARKNQPQAEKSGRAGRQQRRSQANTQTS